MHPAPSVILFSVMSGLGFGYLAFLGAGAMPVSGMAVFGAWALGYGLAVGGLLASTFHLGRPDRAWRAFSQWRSSWLSREAVLSVAALLTLAPMALSDWLGLGLPRWIGWIGAGLALATVGTTAMIYAQLKTVPRWNHWTTPATFFGFALAGGATLAGQGYAPLLLLGLAVLMPVGWHLGDGRFRSRGQTMASATGLGRIGVPRVFEQGHTAGNYLLREMMFRVGRKHAVKLRVIALLAGAVLPALILPLHPMALLPAAILHAIGALAQRWLFFAEAEHVVGLYYGR
jgi:DMSO reductase anchor subunit